MFKQPLPFSALNIIDSLYHNLTVTKAIPHPCLLWNHLAVVISDRLKNALIDCPPIQRPVNARLLRPLCFVGGRSNWREILNLIISRSIFGNFELLRSPIYIALFGVYSALFRPNMFRAISFRCSFASLTRSPPFHVSLRLSYCRMTSSSLVCDDLDRVHNFNNRSAFVDRTCLRPIHMQGNVANV